jgi:hypothetical protein
MLIGAGVIVEVVVDNLQLPLSLLKLHLLVLVLLWIHLLFVLPLAGRHATLEWLLLLLLAELLCELLDFPALLDAVAPRVVHQAPRPFIVTVKMPGPKGIIILKSDQCDALVCENAALTHVGWFGEKEVHELAAKMAKTHGGSTLVRTAMPKPPIGSTPRPPVEKKSTFVDSTSNQPTVDQLVDDKKGATDNEVVADPDDTDKKLLLDMELDTK